MGELIFLAFNYLSVEWDVHVAILNFNLSNVFKGLKNTTHFDIKLHLNNYTQSN